MVEILKDCMVMDCYHPMAILQSRTGQMEQMNQEGIGSVYGGSLI